MTPQGTLDDRQSELVVRPARREEWTAALAMMLQGGPPEQRDGHVRETLESERDGRVRLDGLLIAESRGVPVAAVLYLLQPDGVAIVWPPSAPMGLPAGTEPIDVEDRLWAAAVAAIESAGAAYGQFLLDPAADIDRRIPARHGFVHVADLETWDRLLDDSLPRRPIRRGNVVRFDSVRSEERFASLMERTYAETRDMPAFTGRRSGRESLQTHRIGGAFDPAMWMLFEVDSRDAALLLLTPHPDRCACELAYLGVVPEFRGQGLGIEIVAEGLHVARDRGHLAMHLAVDSENHYAKRVYRLCGFLPTGLREAWIRWPAKPSGCDIHSENTTGPEREV